MWQQIRVAIDCQHCGHVGEVSLRAIYPGRMVVVLGLRTCALVLGIRVE
jgi:hypothetical protein